MKYKILVSISLLSLLVIFDSYPAAAENYYVDAAGGNDGNTGTSVNEPWRTIAKVTNSKFRPGDTVCLKRGGVWEETLIVSSSGKDGQPITYTSYGVGPNPRIKCSNTFSGWLLWVSQSRLKVWKGSIGGVRNSWAAMKDGRRVPRHSSYAFSNIQHMKNGYFFAPLNKSVFYLRHDSGNPGPMEIGAREYGIHLMDQEFIVIDSIDVYGPGGRRDRGSDTGFRQIVADNCRAVHIKNCTLSFHNTGGASIIHDSSDCLYENVNSYGHRSTGLYFKEAGKGNRAINCQVHNCGRLETDHGDMGLIGVWRTPGVLIENCYFHDNGQQGISRMDAAISFVQSRLGTVKRCLIKNVGGTAIQFAEKSDNGLAGYNIIDTWGVFGATNMNEGIRVGGGVGPTAIGCEVYNNLFINGGKTQGRWAALRILNEQNHGLRVMNNIFYNNAGVFEILAESRSNFRDWVLSNNVYFRTQGQAIGFSNKTYDYNHIIGYETGYYSYDQNQEKGSFSLDPKLTATMKNLRNDSPCIDKGIYVGLSTDYYGNPVPSGSGVDIGPFEYQVAESRKKHSTKEL